MHRGSILRVASDRVVVKFVDFGDTMKLTLDKVCQNQTVLNFSQLNICTFFKIYELPKEYRTVPEGATHCMLNSSAYYSTFRKLRELIVNKTLKCKILDWGYFAPGPMAPFLPRKM